MDINYIQGDNQPPFNTGKVGIDLSLYIADAKATAEFAGRIVAGATAIATTIVIDPGTANRLHPSGVGAGLRARVKRTGEWILITAIAGQSATITRAQLDSDAVATVVAPLLANDEIFIVPLDASVLTAVLDPADTTNQTAICTFTAAQTRINEGTYDLKVRFTDGSNRITWPTPAMDAANLIISTDANGA